MHTPVPNNAAADPMAAWRANGGAFEAPPAPAGAAGDDGLMASPVTIFVPCHGDDGLTANRVTSPAGGCPPFADDGLAAGGSPTRPPECWGVAVIEDDGLAASAASPTYPGFCWGPR
ncbi:hypothetical protein [Shumkonia mesophila]|uniref:hypothetical protein n=1 Tax=Shumkonia mesophila TaxID=2838854 RepID=UPI002934AACB|nr:hypothetical protein [Shumkonia mesophila]